RCGPVRRARGTGARPESRSRRSRARSPSRRAPDHAGSHPVCGAGLAHELRPRWAALSRRVEFDIGVAILLTGFVLTRLRTGLTVGLEVLGHWHRAGIAEGPRLVARGKPPDHAFDVIGDRPVLLAARPLACK